MKPCLHCEAPFWCQPCRDVGGWLQEKKFCSNACSRTYQRAQGPTRFWAKVDKAGPGGCWLYTGFKKWDGYGWLARSKGEGKYRYVTAHRYAWILAHGEPADGLQVLHRCDVPACCNPAHLFLGTHADNMADAHAKGRAGRKGSNLWPDRVRPRR